MYVLGIDGGGTKTAGVLADCSGRAAAMITAGPTNQNGADMKAIEHELKRMLDAIKSQNEEGYSQISAVFAGMSGVDHPESKARMRAILEKLLPPSVQIMIDNDGVNALYSGTLGEAGIVHISGTGSISFGVNPLGERARAGGWGYLVDDEGSGYALGRDAVNAVFKDYDGRGKPTLLTSLITEHFQLESVPDLITHIYEPGKARAAMAPLSRLVAEAADRGDEIAGEIIRKAAVQMSESIGSVIGRLFKGDASRGEAIPVVLVGGVHSRADLFVPVIKEELARTGCHAEFIRPDVPPVFGALTAAWKHTGNPVTKKHVQNFKNSWRPE